MLASPPPAALSDPPDPHAANKPAAPTAPVPAISPRRVTCELIIARASGERSFLETFFDIFCSFAGRASLGLSGLLLVSGWTVVQRA